jgi:hypothetical protein
LSPQHAPLTKRRPRRDWNLEVERTRPRGDREIVLKLKQDGDKLTGTITGFQGDDQIKDGKVEGEKITFKVSSEFGGTTRVTTYTCTITGESLKGKAETVFSRDIDAKRAKRIIRFHHRDHGEHNCISP